MIKNSSLNLHGWNGITLFLTLLFTLLVLLVAELVVRLDVFQAPLSTPHMGSSHYQLGQKLAFLDRQIQRNGPVDCVMIGSSMVDVGFDPEVFENAYRAVSGHDIHCFNFGVDASSALSVNAIARIIMEDYHPRLLIVGTDARDYVLPADDSDVAVIMETPWIQYRLDNFSMEGWLMENSYFYRYRQHLGRLVRFIQDDTLLSETYYARPLLPNGYTPIARVSDHANNPPDLSDESYEVQYYSRIFASYEMLDLNMDAMDEILSYNGSDVQVLVVEMPVPDGYYYFLGKGRADYQQFIQGVTALTNGHGVPFWQTEPMDLIAENGWSDFSHLNITGAEAFSTWLGQQVAHAELDGTLRNFDD